MTYPPTPGQGGVHPPPPDPPIEAYQPPPAPAPPPFQQSMSPYQAPPPQYRPGPPYDHVRPTGPYEQRPAGTDGMAIASLVVSCTAVLGLCGLWVGAVLGVVGAALGHAGRRRVRMSGQQGAGMALAGIIVGWSVTAIAVLGTILVVLLSAADS